MKKNLMQRYGLLRQIPNKAMISLSSCCDNRLDFGQYSKTSFFFVVICHRKESDPDFFVTFSIFAYYIDRKVVILSYARRYYSRKSPKYIWLFARLIVTLRQNSKK